MEVLQQAIPDNSDSITLEALMDQPRWVAWQLEESGKRLTKVPYSPHGGKARANDPSTWGLPPAALARYDRLPKSYELAGIGLELGDLTDGRSLGGVDLDTCREPDGQIAPWAQDVIDRFATYTEVSPSQTGAKLLFLYHSSDLPILRQLMGNDWSKNFKMGDGEHPPGIELHVGGRYFAITGDGLDTTVSDIRFVSVDDVRWLIQEAGPAFIGASSKPKPKPTTAPVTGKADQSRSAQAMVLGAALKRAGADFDTMCAALSEHRATSDWVAEKGESNGRRELRRIWDKVEVSEDSIQANLPEPSRALLDRAMLPAPKLPLVPFGAFWGEWILQAAQGANAPPDYTAVALLSVASAIIGNARWAKAWAGWAEPPVLWCCGVGDPSSGKTPGASPVVRDVLSKVEDWITRDHAALHHEWVERNAVAVARKKAWEKDVQEAILTGEEPPPLPNDVDSEDEPEAPRVRVSNITIEKMVNILARQPKGLLCVNDELAQWFSNFQRYSSGSDRPFWLEAYNGGPFRLDRMSRSEPLRIPRLSVAVFGTAQPDRLASILKDADDGLVGRFLFTWPEPIEFRRPTSYANMQAAFDALGRLADLTMPNDDNGQPVPSFIVASDDAAEMLESFGRSLVEQEKDAHGLMKGIIGKARGQTLRLALILEFLWWCAGDHAEPTTIHGRVMEAAIRLMETYFLPMSQRVLADVAIPRDEIKARTLAKWIVATRPATVNITAIRDSAHLPGLRETDDVKAAVQYLVEAKWLIEVPRPSGAGRPRGDYRVNPRLWDILAPGSE